MLRRLFERKTKWLVLAAYNADGNDYIIFVRKGVKTGMLYFKIKNTSPFGRCSYQFKGNDLVNIKTQFDLVIHPANN